MDKLDCNLMTTSLAGGIRSIKLFEKCMSVYLTCAVMRTSANNVGFLGITGSLQFKNPVEDQHKNCDLTVPDIEAEEYVSLIPLVL